GAAEKAPVEPTVGLESKALVDECLGERGEAPAQGGLRQRPVDDVALGVAASELVRDESPGAWPRRRPPPGSPRSSRGRKPTTASWTCFGRMRVSIWVVSMQAWPRSARCPSPKHGQRASD